MHAMSARLKLTSPLAVLSLLSAGYALSFFHRVCPSVLAVDLMKDFSLDAASFSLISSATMLGYALTQIPSGLLADIVGGRRTLALYQALAGIFCILFAFCDNLLPAVVCRFLLGLTLASNVPSYKILASLVPPGSYAKYCSVLTGCGALGTLLAASPLVAAGNLMGWRAALLAAGIFTLLLGGAICVLLNDADCDKGGNHRPSVHENIQALKEGLLVVAKLKNFWLIFIWFMFMVGNLFALLTTWWGAYLMQANCLSKEAAGLSISIMSLGPLLLIMVFPWLSDNVFHSRRVFLLAAALLESLVLACICLHRGEPFSFTTLTALGLFLSIATTCMGPLSFTMIKESVPPSALASACGFLNCSGPAVAAVVQSLFGAVLAWRVENGATELAAYGDAFLLMLGGSVLAFIATLFMKDTLEERS